MVANESPFELITPSMSGGMPSNPAGEGPGRMASPTHEGELAAPPVTWVWVLRMLMTDAAQAASNSIKAEFALANLDAPALICLM